MKKKGNRKRLTKLTAMVTLLAMTVSMLAGCSKFMPKSKTPAVPEQTWAEEQGLFSRLMAWFRSLWKGLF